MTAAAATLRLGTVPYLNARPLVAELEYDPDISLQQDVPSVLAQQLRAGELDAALVSSVELFRDPPLGWVGGQAIASRGPVGSILLFLNTEPENLKRVALDASSLTAAAMTRVCLAEFLGCPAAEFTSVSPELALNDIDADAVLRIGDRAVATAPGGRSVLDLGQVWTDATQLPFVYALWLTRPGLSGAPLVEKLTSAGEKGVAKRFEIARAFARIHQLDPRVCVEYLRSNIVFDFGPDEQAGLAHFGALAHRHGLVDRPTLPEQA